jgi:hypothetical protein
LLTLPLSERPISASLGDRFLDLIMSMGHSEFGLAKKAREPVLSLLRDALGISSTGYLDPADIHGLFVQQTPLLEQVLQISLRARMQLCPFTKRSIPDEDSIHALLLSTDHCSSLTVQAALDKFEYLCPECGNNDGATRIMTLVRCPHLLVLQIDTERENYNPANIKYDSKINVGGNNYTFSAIILCGAGHCIAIVRHYIDSKRSIMVQYDDMIGRTNQTYAHAICSEASDDIFRLGWQALTGSKLPVLLMYVKQ